MRYGIDPAYWKGYLENLAVNSLMNRSHQRPLGELYTGNMLGYRDEVEGHPTHREWARSQRLGDYIGINAIRSGSCEVTT